MVSPHRSGPSEVSQARCVLVWRPVYYLIRPSFTDWFFFLILNIGIPIFDAVPVGQRLLLGLVQAVAVRFAGFQSILVSALAPAEQ
jgi:Trk-type K+ transport system membrane component